MRPIGPSSGGMKGGGLARSPLPARCSGGGSLQQRALTRRERGGEKHRKDPHDPGPADEHETRASGCRSMTGSRGMGRSGSTCGERRAHRRRSVVGRGWDQSPCVGVVAGWSAQLAGPARRSSERLPALAGAALFPGAGAACLRVQPPDGALRPRVRCRSEAVDADHGLFVGRGSRDVAFVVPLREFARSMREEA